MTQEKVTAFNWKRFWEGAALGFAVPLLLLIALIGEIRCSFTRLGIGEKG